MNHDELTNKITESIQNLGEVASDLIRCGGDWADYGVKVLEGLTSLVCSYSQLLIDSGNHRVTKL
jgi:hypothetical protein